ncbi:MAG: hypothetical protein U9R05_09890 [Chloroflexota bacterium]|nr:hypothetical protein [Chloroflexota bacterium]
MKLMPEAYETDPELLPLITRLEKTRQVSLRPAARRRIWRRVLEKRATQRPRWFAFQMHPRLRHAMSLALIVVLLFGVLGIAFVAGGSLPGDPLYAVKRASESAGLALVPQERRGEVRLILLERRVKEIGSLLALGYPIPDDLLSEYESSMDEIVENPADWGMTNGQILPYVERNRRVLNSLAFVYPNSPGIGRMVAASSRAWESLW